MKLTRTLPALLAHDARRLLRDRFLLGTNVYIVGMAFVMRWAIPWATARLLQETDFDATPYHALVVSYFVLVNTTVLTGLLAGFLLMETRELHTIQALRITPMPLWHLFVELGVGTIAIGTVIAIVEGFAIGVGTPGPTAMALCSLLVAPQGLVLALILATQATNKVEAFAVLKITAIIGLIPICAWFLPEPWQLLAGVVPPYWACRIWWETTAGEAVSIGSVAGSIVCSSVWIAVWTRRFLHRIER